MKKSALLFFVSCVGLLPLVGFSLELHPQIGHTGPILCVTYSKDGKYLASADIGGAIKLWEISSGKELRSFHGVDADFLAFSPDGSLIAASDEYALKIWEAATGKERYSFEGGSILFTPDGRLLASVGQDKTARVWEVASGKKLFSFSGEFIALSPDGKTLASINRDKLVQLWEMKSGKELRSFSITAKSIPYQLEYTPDGKNLIAVIGDILYLIDASSGKEVRSFKGYVGKLDPKGRYWASTPSFSNNLSLWDLSTGKEAAALPGHNQDIKNLVFSPDGTYLASASEDSQGLIKLWEVASGKELLSLSVMYPEAMVFSPDSTNLATSTNAGFTTDEYDAVQVWELSSGKKLRDFVGQTSALTDVAFSPDGRHLTISSWNYIRRWELQKGRELGPLAGSYDTMRMAYSPDGRYLAGGGRDGNVWVWELKNGKEKIIFSFFREIPTGLETVSFSADSKMVCATFDVTEPKAWQIPSGKEVTTLSEEDFAAKCQPLDRKSRKSPDGKYLAEISGQTIKLKDAATNKELRSFVGHTSSVLTLAFSPDSRFLASIDLHNTTRVWRVDGAASMVLVSSQSGEWLIYTDDGLFDSSPGGVSLVSAIDGMKGYNIDQLAIKNNRPDLILQSMGLGSPELIDYYYKRYLNRLKKAKLEESQLKGAFQDLPKATITKTELASDAQLSLSLTLEDKESLKFYQLYLNGVATYEGFGKEVSGKKQSLTEKIALTSGVNRIEVSAINASGQESLRELVFIQGPELAPDLYFVGFGVSDYLDKDIPDLKYADKDAKELGQAFEKLKGYNQKIIKIFVNEQVNKASLTEAKELLKKARPQDTVVLFIAGHGMHDRDELATYYYITHDTQLTLSKDGPPTLDASTAISFEEIEGLLSGLQARQKLFLMDTCESGERDESDAALALLGASSRGLGARAIGVSKISQAPKKTAKKPKKSNARPWLLERDRYIYQDLAKRTGAIVFSSSRGGEYSFESKKLENGLFTEALLQALSGKAADQNKNGSISEEELQKYVNKEVATLSSDLQHPTVDRNNLYLRLSFTP